MHSSITLPIGTWGSQLAGGLLDLLRMSDDVRMSDDAILVGDTAFSDLASAT